MGVRRIGVTIVWLSVLEDLGSATGMRPMAREWLGWLGGRESLDVAVAWGFGAFRCGWGN
ncbi:unnamed protein product [Prunus armeniaca]